MNIITNLNELITKNFNKFLTNYFNNMNYVDKQGTFSNYYNFINDLDSFNDSFIKDIIKAYFEYIDECFFNSTYRKRFCKSNGFYERKNLVLDEIKNCTNVLAIHITDILILKNALINQGQLLCLFQ